MNWKRNMNGRQGAGMGIMKSGKSGMGSHKSNVDPSIKEDSHGRESIEQGHSEHSEGVIPPAVLKKHGLHISGPQAATFDPKKQADLPDHDEGDYFP